MDTPEVHNPIGKPDLFSKVGPLPAWAWGAIVVAAFLAYRKFHPTSAAAVDPGNLVASASDASLPDTSTVSGGGGGIDPSSSGYNYGDVLAGNYTGSTSGAVFATNQQWGVYAINNLPKLGYPAGEVTSAITFFLAGMPLTATQKGIVAAAISNYGSPPLPQPLVAAVDPATPAAKPVVVTDQPTTPTQVGNVNVPYIEPTFASNTAGQIGHDYAVDPNATQAQRAAALDAWLKAVS